jgi:hypothetical protein
LIGRRRDRRHEEFFNASLNDRLAEALYRAALAAGDPLAGAGSPICGRISAG